MPLSQVPESSLSREILSADDLCVELGGLPVLRGVSFTVREGEAVALLGGNGSGKSTLVRSLLRLVPSQRGEVRLFGTELAAFSSWEQVGYVPQRSTLGLSRAKVREVVASGRLARRTPFLPATKADRRAVLEALAAVGLRERAGDEMAHLSGGQQQRVLIARALVSEPRLLVLDEPTAGVDLEHQRTLAEVLSALLGRGTSVLVVLHEIGALADLIDRAVTLRQGRVVHDGDLASWQQLNAETGRPEHGGHEYEPPSQRRDFLDGALGGQQHGPGAST